MTMFARGQRHSSACSQRREYVSNSKRPGSANAAHHVLMSLQARERPRQKEEERGRNAVDRNPDHLRQALGRRRASSGRQATVIVSRTARSNAQEKTVPAKKEDKKKKKKKEKPRKRSSSCGSSCFDASTGSESQRKKGGKSSSSTAPAAVCLLRAMVMAAVVSQGSCVPITRQLGSVAMPVLSSSQTMCTDFDNAENIDSFVKQQIRFDDCPRVFTHAVESSPSWRAVQSRPKKKRKRFTPDRPEYAEAVRVATEDATIAASHLQNAVRNELCSLPAACSYLCNSDVVFWGEIINFSPCY